MLMLCCMALLLSACDAHRDFPDTSTQVCDILCTDGKVVSQSQLDKSGKEAIAVVYHINHDENVEGTGFAVYLWDMPPAAFADSIGVKQGTSGSLTDFDGNANTYALFSTKDMSSPMARWFHKASLTRVARKPLQWSITSTTMRMWREQASPYISGICLLLPLLTASV